MRHQRLLTAFMLLPFVLMAGVWTSSWIPPTWRNLYLLAVFGGVLGFIFVVPIREHLRRERQLGLATGGGYSKKLKSAAQKLREHAAEVEACAEEGVEILPPSAVLISYLAELRRLAREQDKQPDRIPKVQFRETLDDAKTARELAGKLELYAQDVRLRGGIFKLGLGEIIAGAILLAGGIVWGCRLIWRWWSTPGWSFFGGVFLVVACTVVAYGLYRSQGDSA